MRNKWDWREVDLSKDAVDMANPELEMGTLAMTRNLSFQFALDSIAATSIAQVMGPFVSNTELLGAIQEWEVNEYAHALQYSQITKKAFVNPNELFEQIKTTEPLLKRLAPIQKIFEETKRMAMYYALGMPEDPLVLQKQIIKYHATLLAAEGIAFSASFAATFGVARAYKAYEGIKNSIQLITRDELDTHVKLGLTILKHLKAAWPEAWAAVQLELQGIYYLVYELEVEWLDHLFDGVVIRGLTPELLDKYVRFLMKPIMLFLGLEYKYESVDKNPIPWMDEYINLGDIQVAAQETQLVNYNVNIINDNVKDDVAMELDFDF